jgi:molybdopterin/thiamine biosynthesis adenylyltransferase
MQPAIFQEIKKCSHAEKLPDGSPYQGIGVKDVVRLAAMFHMPGRQIEVIALEHGIIPVRYARNRMTYSSEEQIRLLRAHAAVVGQGGLGGILVETLARAGVGELTLIDADRFEDHNLNRQQFSSEAVLGQSKALCAAQRIALVNSSVVVHTHSERLQADNAGRLLGSADVAVDCLDNIATRFTVQEAARKLQRPFVSAAVGGLAGHITTILPGDEGLELIYGPPDELKSASGAEATLGCLPQAVNLIAALQASQVLKVLAGHTRLLRNRLMLVDLSDDTVQVLQLR